jgi:S-DNA-T family DNA segregation ATPase FtsK/SpoIIIE
MAAKKSTRKPVKRKTASRRAKQVPILTPEQKHMIGAFVCSALTLLLLFAVGNFGGSLVTSMFHYLRLVVGYTAFMMWVVTLVLAIMLFRRDSPPRGHNYFGFVLLVLSMSALFHVGIAPAAAADTASQGNGGGFLGYLVANAMLNVLNVAACSVVLLTLLLISIILATNVDLGELFHNMAAGLKREPRDKAVADKALKVNDPTAEVLKVNDNSGASTLPVRGQLDLGGATPKKPVKEESQEALTSKGDDSWKSPSLELLQLASSKADAGDVKANAATIKSTMDSFGINVQMDEVNVGPTVTQYTFIPPAGVKLNKITTLDTNLALSLAAHPIRIEAPIPGKSAVGVEVPNKTIAMVRLRGVLDSPEWKGEKAPLTFALGRDVSGIPMNSDLAKMPHMLIAGATGSGKSAMINSFLTSLLYRNSPNDMKLILVDPKRVELGLYNDIPHLLTPVIVEPEKCISALKWAVAEMERRYKLLAEVGNRNIIEYNKAHPDEAMPYIVIVIDEMADLMVLAAADVESLIVRLAQMARAIGIHLVLATQRPSVDVITGIIKANIPARLAFSVASQVDSRTILDQMGAEKLLGKGDMLFSSPDFMKPRRIQGAFLDENEVKAVTDYLREQRQPQYNEEVLNQKVTIGGKSAGGGSGGGDGEIDDDLFDEAAEAVIRAGKASTSMLQRRLRVGYARAARLIDLLEEQGVVGPPDGARPRDVLVSSLDQVRGGGAGMAAGGVAGVEEMRPAEPYDE